MQDRSLVARYVDNGANGSIENTQLMVNHGKRSDRDNAGDSLALILDGDGKVTNRYLYGALVDEVLAEETLQYDANNNVTSEVLWGLSDHQGSVRDWAKIGSEVSVVKHVDYDPFGNVIDTQATNAAIATMFGYTGRSTDPLTKLQDNRARSYDPTLGRFISQDPMGFDAGNANLYRMVGNHPSYATDPSGLVEDYRKLFFDAARQFAANASPILEEILEMEKELSYIESLFRGKRSKFWEVHHWYSQKPAMDAWLSKQLPQIGSVNDPRNLSAIPYHIHTEITEEQLVFWTKVGKENAFDFQRNTGYDVLADRLNTLDEATQANIAKEYDEFVADQRKRFNGFYLDVEFKATDFVKVIRNATHDVPLGLSELAAKRLAKNQAKFVEKLKVVASKVKESAKWMKESGKIVAVPFLAMIAVGAGPIVNYATAKEEAVDDLTAR